MKYEKMYLKNTSVMNNCTITSILALPNVLLHYVAWSISKQTKKNVCAFHRLTMYGHILFLLPVSFFYDSHWPVRS